MYFLFSTCRKHFILIGLISYFFGTLHDIIIYFHENKFSAFDWKITQYHVNYIDFGFVKRGLVGTVLYPFLSAFQTGGMWEIVFLWSLDLACFFLVLILLHRALRHLPAEWSDWLRVVIIFSPIGIMQYAYDVGRYDHFNYLVIAGIIACLMGGRFALASLIMTAGILLHEAVFFYALPLMIAAIWLKRKPLAEAALLAVGPVAAMALVVLFGNASAELMARLPAAISGGAEVWGRSILEPAYNFGVRNAIILAVYLALLMGLVLRYAMTSGGPSLMLMLPVICCLPLFGLGIDYFRWVHLMFVAFMSTAILLALQAPGRPIAMTTWDKGLVLALATPAGPIGVEWGLPLAIKLLSLLAHRIAAI